MGCPHQRHYPKLAAVSRSTHVMEAAQTDYDGLKSSREGVRRGLWGLGGGSEVGVGVGGGGV